MSEEAKAAEEKKEEAPAKKGKGGVILGVVAVIFVCASSAAGAIVAPIVAAKYQKQQHNAQKKHAEEEDDEEDESHKPAAASCVLDPIVVDLKAADGTSHHLKLGMTLELKSKPHDEEENKAFTPRARAAALEYARVLSYDEATDAKKFDHIRKELSERVLKAAGKKHVKKLLITDFVVQ